MNEPDRPDEVLEAAAAWHTRIAMSERSVSLQAEFDRWHQRSDAHRIAYDEVSKAVGEARGRSGSTEMLMLRHETLARAVVPRRKRWSGMALAAGLAGAAVVGGVSVRHVEDARQDVTSAGSLAFERRIYKTGIGERLTIALPDGSVATLNTASRLEVAFTPGERRLALTRGQAFFQVAKQPDRPFVVAVADRLVTAHGTKFDVRLESGTLRVALLEGEVTVAPRRPEPGVNGTAMKPNEILVASGMTTSVRPADATRAVSWRSGVVVFDDTPLADALADMNRYVARPAVPADAAVGALRISGSFRTDARPVFLEALQAGFGLQISDRDPERLVVTSGPPAPSDRK